MSISEIHTNVLHAPPQEVNQLPPSQYDTRNVNGLRFIELGWQTPLWNFVTVPPTPEVDESITEPLTITVPTGELQNHFFHDPSMSFRVITLQLESYYIKRRFTTLPANIRIEPIAIQCDALQKNSGGRYMVLLPNDFSQLSPSAGATSFSFTGNFPSSLQFKIGLVNPDPDDTKIYNFNNPRYTSFPIFTPQEIWSITIRLSVKVSLEPNHIPFVAPMRGLGFGGICGNAVKQSYGQMGSIVPLATSGGSAGAGIIQASVQTAALTANVMQASQAVNEIPIGGEKVGEGEEEGPSMAMAPKKEEGPSMAPKKEEGPSMAPKKEEVIYEEEEEEEGQAAEGQAETSGLLSQASGAGGAGARMSILAPLSGTEPMPQQGGVFKFTWADFVTATSSDGTFGQKLDDIQQEIRDGIPIRQIEMKYNLKPNSLRAPLKRWRESGIV